jgi:hypothetical protein
MKTFKPQVHLFKAHSDNRPKMRCITYTNHDQYQWDDAIVRPYPSSGKLSALVGIEVELKLKVSDSSPPNVIGDESFTPVVHNIDIPISLSEGIVHDEEGNSLTKRLILVYVSGIDTRISDPAKHQKQGSIVNYEDAETDSGGGGNR